MDEANTSYVLQSQQMGHEVPGDAGHLQPRDPSDAGRLATSPSAPVAGVLTAAGGTIAPVVRALPGQRPGGPERKYAGARGGAPLPKSATRRRMARPLRRLGLLTC